MEQKSTKNGGKLLRVQGMRVAGRQPDWFFLIKHSIWPNEKQVLSICNFPRRDTTSK